VDAKKPAGLAVKLENLGEHLAGEHTVDRAPFHPNDLAPDRAREIRRMVGQNEEPLLSFCERNLA
jgi:hypothetical protein